MSKFMLFLLLVSCEGFTQNQRIKDVDKETPSKFTYHHHDKYGEVAPSNWSLVYPHCDGKAQSPINIQRSSVIRKKALFVMNYFRKKVDSVKLRNNGHAISMNFKFFNDVDNTLYWSINNQSYIFSSLHIHWGSMCYGGSEHTIDYHRFAGEVHIVHYNSKYQSIDEAASKSDGLAVVAVFFELAEQSKYDPNIDVFAKYAKYLTIPNYTYTINKQEDVFNVRDIIKYEISEYYTYEGSLTTPPCYESVRFFIAMDTIRIFPSQLDELRKLREDEFSPLYTNYRPEQPLNGRKVFLYFNDDHSHFET